MLALQSQRREQLFHAHIQRQARKRDKPMQARQQTGMRMSNTPRGAVEVLGADHGAVKEASQILQVRDGATTNRRTIRHAAPTASALQNVS